MEALLRRWISLRWRCSVQQPFKAEKEEQARRSKQVNGEEDSRRGARLFTATHRGVWGSAGALLPRSAHKLSQSATQSDSKN